MAEGKVEEKAEVSAMGKPDNFRNPKVASLDQVARAEA